MDHVARNRDAWTKWSNDFEAPGRRCWEASAITWGIWSVPESDVDALGGLDWLRDKDSIELGCGTGYVSAWLAKLGARPVGVDITPAQLESARGFQQEFGIEFPLIEASAENVPLPDKSFDLAISEYGASIWCDPYKWIPEAARLLRPGGVLVFLRNSTLSMLCQPQQGPATPELVNGYFGLNRMEFEGDEGVEFHLPTGPMIRLLRSCGFEIEAFVEIEPPTDAQPTVFEYMTLEWARRWPSEEIWRARLTRQPAPE